MPRSIPAPERSAPPGVTQDAATGVNKSSVGSQRMLAPELTQWWELAEDLLCVVDRRQRITRVNPAFQRLLGWTSEDLVGEDPLGLVHPDDEQMVRASLRQGGGTIRDLKARWR